MKDFLLLQINDALFPVGGYSHSYGLETYIQKNLVYDRKSALDYVRKYTGNSLLHGDLLAAKLAWEICQGEQESVMEQLQRLDQVITASRLPFELRQASEKIASRFLKTLLKLPIDYSQPWFKLYGAAKEPFWKKNYAVAYGVFCAGAGLGLDESLSHLLYAQTSALVTNCVKTIPLSQTDGQQILYECLKTSDRLLERVKGMGMDDYAVSLPGADIRSMQHEALYSRLYMS
ncbi:MAG: urease accessory protein UreF [Lachnospiraceae bacterium]|nr:urease accessory protein UreF [Lachnospiraceae bacterium]MDY4970894.1 urease accessory protein UreF [Lachnospiraceae bacterium]